MQAFANMSCFQLFTMQVSWTDHPRHRHEQEDRRGWPHQICGHDALSATFLRRDKGALAPYAPFSCANWPAMSPMPQCSANLPLATRKMSQEVKRSDFPVAGTP